MVRTTKYYSQIDDFDHGSFMLGKDMSYLNDCLSLLKDFNWREIEKAEEREEERAQEAGLGG